MSGGPDRSARGGGTPPTSGDDSLPTASPPPEPLQRLRPQGGAGVPLAAAAADVASNGSRYTARTQLSTVLAYHVMAENALSPEILAPEIHRLHDRPRGSLYVAPGPVIGSWLPSVGSGRVGTAVTSEPAACVAPIGVWFLDDVGRLVDATIGFASMITTDAASITAAGIAAGAIAAASHLMTGPDLVLGAAETGTAVVDALAGLDWIDDMETARMLPVALDGVKHAVGSTALEVESLLARAGTPDVLLPILQAVVMASPAWRDPIDRIEHGVALGGDAAVVTGALVGGQAGLRRWPWRVANETWFAEIGRRMQARHPELGDLPIPHAVEERMRVVADQGFEGG